MLSLKFVKSTAEEKRGEMESKWEYSELDKKTIYHVI